VELNVTDDMVRWTMTDVQHGGHFVHLNTMVFLMTRSFSHF
jgi:hypothetical protein